MREMRTPSQKEAAFARQPCCHVPCRKFRPVALRPTFSDGLPFSAKLNSQGVAKAMTMPVIFNSLDFPFFSYFILHYIDFFTGCTKVSFYKFCHVFI